MAIHVSQKVQILPKQIWKLEQNVNVFRIIMDKIAEYRMQYGTVITLVNPEKNWNAEQNHGG